MGSRDHACPQCGRGGMNEPPCQECTNLSAQIEKQTLIISDLARDRATTREALKDLIDQIEGMGLALDAPGGRGLRIQIEVSRRALLQSEPATAERVVCDVCGSSPISNPPHNVGGSCRFVCIDDESVRCPGHYRRKP